MKIRNRFIIQEQDASLVLARHQGTQVPLTGIKAGMAANDTDSLHVETVSSYIEVLKKNFVIEDMEAWNPNLRSMMWQFFNKPSFCE